jgi:hypothetical protein
VQIAEKSRFLKASMKPNKIAATIGYPKHPKKGSWPLKSCAKIGTAMIRLPSELKEFLALLNENKVEYLLVGGYAVGLHGYVRNTQDIDFWINAMPENINRVARALDEFGFADPEIPAILSEPANILRIGNPPLRIEIMGSISGVKFEDCYPARTKKNLDGVDVDVISMADIKKNKTASGRTKDILDLENLP